MSLRVQRGHDSANWETCMCGEQGCGSYRPFGRQLTMREYDAIGLWLEAEREFREEAEDEHMVDLISDRWDDKHLG